MTFIDLHCHIDMMENISEIINNARRNNVKIIINNGINIETNRKTLELAKKYLEIKCALGIYPIDALKLSNEDLEKEIKFIKENNEKIIAIGEVGIDLKWSKDLEKQKKIFQKFIDLALEIDKPLIVHARGAEKDVIELLEKNKCERVLMHCFCGSGNLVKRIVNNGWYLSIPANVVFSEQFQQIVEMVDLENLFCETDSPYLHPIKGKRNNEPANVMESYKKIAEIKGLSLEKVEKKIRNNFNRLFG